MNLQRHILTVMLVSGMFMIAIATSSAATNKTSKATNPTPTETGTSIGNTNAPATTNDFRSVFESGGRDPFFPRSARQPAAVADNNESQPTVILVLKGFSGSAKRRFAIINDHTFAAGDESEVNTASGRMRIRCHEIRSDVAVVSIGSGPKIELRLPNRF